MFGLWSTSADHQMEKFTIPANTCNVRSITQIEENNFIPVTDYRLALISNPTTE